MDRNFKLQTVVCLCALSLVWQLGITRAKAQGTAAAILGTVTDASGASVADAAISVKNVGTGITQNTTSDAQGRYRASDLPVGDYEVTAMKTGFSTIVHSGITLTVGAQTVVDFSMAVGQQQQTITVQGEVSQVETTSTAVADLVESTQIRELPLNGRNFSQLLTLAPGVVPTAPSGGLFGNNIGFAIAGARAEGGAYLLDNTDIEDWWNHGSGSGALGTSLGVDGIGEFQVLTNTYSAQFGGDGSVINAVSKSGTNSFHGSAYEFLRNSDLDARNFFDHRIGPPPFRRNQFGGTVGGPVKKDKAFFFVNDEGLRSSLGTTAIAFVPDVNARNGYLPCNVAKNVVCNTATNLAYVGIAPSIASTMALFPAASNATSTGVAQVPEVASQVAHENYLVARMDYNFSEKDSLFVRYVFDRASQLSPLLSPNTIPSWPELDITANHFATIQERHIFSPTLINLAQISFSRPHDGGVTTGQTSPLNYWPGSGWNDGGVSTSGLASLGPSAGLPFTLIINKFVESDDVVWTHGAHSVTLGASVNRQQDNGSGPIRQSGGWTFTSLENLMLAAPTTFTGGIPGLYSATRSIRELLFAFYGNDSWKVSSRLTVNLGLRYEPTDNPTEVFGNYHVAVNPPFNFEQVPHFFASNISLKNLDPRIGFAYDPFKDHKTSIRGGFGTFHNVVTARTLGSCTFGTFPGTQYTQSVNLVYPFPLTDLSNAPPQLIPACGYTNWTPYMMQYNLNVQRDIGGGTILTVGYIGSHGVHLMEATDTNAPISAGGPDGPYASIINNAIVTNPRPNPAYTTVEAVTGDGNSNYNSLQVGVTRRFLRNWQAQLSYTWSRALDVQSSYWGEPGTPSSGAENPGNLSWDYGPASFNRTHVITANSVYMLPFAKNWLVRGWQVSGIFTASSGLPVNVTNGINQEWAVNNQPQRPNLVPGCNPQVGLVTEWYNPNCFTIPAVGFIGNLGRNIVVGPDLFNTDFSVMKDTRITKISEQLAVQFRAEFFNIFNRANFSLPASTNFVSGSTVGAANVSSTAGIITTTADSSRQIQFGLKVTF